MFFTTVNVWIWTVLIVIIVVVIAGVWFAGRKIGKKAASVFYETIFSDLREMLSKAGFSETDVTLIINGLRQHQADAVFPATLLRIEYALERKNSTRINRILAVAYLNAANEQLLSRKEREYDWDFIPDELSSELIRAGKENVTIEIYTRKQEF